MNRGRFLEIMNWCIPAGSLSGVKIGIHWMFPLFLALYTLDAREKGGPEWGWIVFLTLILLFAIVLAHEFGHVFAARREGVRADRVMIWPLGGLAHLGEERTGTAEVRIAAAGPAVNLLFAIALIPALALLGIRLGLPLLDPFAWAAASTMSGEPSSFVQDLAVSLYRANWIVLLFNLIPAFPMDGGRIVRGLLHTRIGLVRSTLAVTTIAFALVAVFVVWAVATSNFILLLIAAFVGFSAFSVRRQVQASSGPGGDGGFMGYDFSMGNTSLSDAREDRAAKKREMKEREKARREAREEREVEQELDRLLDKISREGMESLSRRDRAFLQKASRRQKR